MVKIFDEDAIRASIVLVDKGRSGKFHEYDESTVSRQPGGQKLGPGPALDYRGKKKSQKHRQGHQHTKEQNIHSQSETHHGPEARHCLNTVPFPYNQAETKESQEEERAKKKDHEGKQWSTQRLKSFQQRHGSRPFQSEKEPVKAREILVFSYSIRSRGERGVIPDQSRKKTAEKREPPFSKFQKGPQAAS